MPSCVCGGQNPSCARCGGGGSGGSRRTTMTRTDSRGHVVSFSPKLGKGSQKKQTIRTGAQLQKAQSSQNPQRPSNTITINSVKAVIPIPDSSLPVWAVRCPACLLSFHRKYFGLHLRRKHAVRTTITHTGDPMNVGRACVVAVHPADSAKSVRPNNQERLLDKKSKRPGKKGKTFTQKNKKPALPPEDLQRIFESKMSPAGRVGSSRRH
jgi:hypothetical protein